MALTNAQYDSIMHEYEERRSLHRQELEERLQSVYDNIPGYKALDDETATAVFDDIEKYCCYTICKAHAVPYALLAYRTAYLKCHYPEEFAAALKKNDNENAVF